MRQLLERVYDILFHPGGVMPIVAGEKHWGQSATVFFVSVGIPAAGYYFGTLALLKQPVGLIMLLIYIIGCCGLWVVASSVINLFAEFLGAKGNALGLLTCLGYTVIPGAFWVVFWALAGLAPAISQFSILLVGGMIISVWSLVLSVQSIQAAFYFSRWKAVFTLVVPPIILAIAVIMAVVIIGTIVSHGLAWQN